MGSASYLLQVKSILGLGRVGSGPISILVLGVKNTMESDYPTEKIMVFRRYFL